MELIEMRIPVHCDGCEKKLRKSLSRMIGVETVDVDHEQQKVTVMGYVEREKVMKKAKKALTLARYWPFGHYNVRYRHHHRYDYESRGNHRRPVVQHWSHNQSHGYGEVDFPSSGSHQGGYDPSHGHYVGGSGRSSYDHHYGYDHHQYRSGLDDRTTAMFSEENPNSCSVM